MAPKRTAPPRASKEKNAGEYDWKKFKFTVPGVLEMISYHIPDTIAICCAIPVFGFFYNVFASVCGIFVAVSHNVTEAVPGTPALYTTGIFDITFVFYMGFMLFVLHDCLREMAWERLGKKVLGGDRAGQLRFHLDLSNLVVTSFAVNSLLGMVESTGVSSDLSAMWVGYPHGGIGAWVKATYLVCMSYSLEVATLVYLWRDLKTQGAGKLEQDKLITNTFQAAWIAIMYYFQFYRVGALMMLLHMASEWIRTLLVVMRALKGNKAPRTARAWFSPRDSNGIPSLDECIGIVASIATPFTWFVRIAVCGLAVQAFLLGGFGSLEVAEGEDAGHNTAVNRLVMLAATIAWQAIPLLVAPAPKAKAN